MSSRTKYKATERRGNDHQSSLLAGDLDLFAPVGRVAEKDAERPMAGVAESGRRNTETLTHAQGIARVNAEIRSIYAWQNTKTARPSSGVTKKPWI